MLATEHAAAPDFRGSISRRLTVLSVLLFILVATVGGLSVYKARRIESLHAASEELDTHIQILDRLESAVFHLRAETQDALFLGQGFDDPNLRAIPRQIREQWALFEKMHFGAGQPWSAGSPAERALYHELEGNLEHFLSFT